MTKQILAFLFCFIRERLCCFLKTPCGSLNYSGTALPALLFLKRVSIYIYIYIYIYIWVSRLPSCFENSLVLTQLWRHCSFFLQMLCRHCNFSLTKNFVRRLTQLCRHCNFFPLQFFQVFYCGRSTPPTWSGFARSWSWGSWGIIHSVTSSYTVSHHHTMCHIIIHSVTSSLGHEEAGESMHFGARVAEVFFFCFWQRRRWSLGNYTPALKLTFGVVSVTSSYTVSHHHTQSP